MCHSMVFCDTHRDRQGGSLEERSVVDTETEIHPVRSSFHSERNLFPGAYPPSNRLFFFRVRLLLLYQSVLDPAVTSGSGSQCECWTCVYFLERGAYWSD